MCGRFATPNGAAIQKRFHIEDADWDSWLEHYNVAPTQTVPIIVHGREHDLKLMPARWGLIPSWWKKDTRPSLTFNARSEDATEKPTWRHSLKSMRCLMPATGWFEWNESEQTRNTSGKKVNQPYFLHSPTDPVIAIAGLWSVWHNPQGDEVVSCALMTKEAAPSIHAIHHRMPVVLGPEQFNDWLSAKTQPDEIASLIGNARGDFVGRRVSTRVNNTRSDSPDLLDEVASDSLF